MLTQNDLKLPVIYVGTEPLPDTFRDGSQALRPMATCAPTGFLRPSRSRRSAHPSMKASPGIRSPPRLITPPCKIRRHCRQHAVTLWKISAPLAILLAFCFSVYAVVASVAGNWRSNPFLILSAERAVYSELPAPDCGIGHSGIQPDRRGLSLGVCCGALESSYARGL